MNHLASSSRNQYAFTSESVSEGHPDKICDQISDAILDLYLAQNPEARAAVETLATTNRVVIAGETRGVDSVTEEDIEKTVRDVVRKVGYNSDGFDAETLVVDNHLHHQSAEIAQGVDAGGDKDEGAGDQGIMFGFACNETEECMPAPIKFSNRILHNLARARRDGSEPWLRPDAKSQVTMVYEDGKPVRTQSIVVSTQHSPDVTREQIVERIWPIIVASLPDESWMCAEDELFVNPTGSFVVGGPDGDAGLTGRKIIVDTYGGAAPHGGGAFSGKDPTKVDRSAAYAARYLARNVVSAGLAEKCLIQLSYAIGVSRPLSFYVNTYGTSDIPDQELERVLPTLMDLSPRGIREHLQLNKPIYLASAAYGHFGRRPRAEGHFSWEKNDLENDIKKAFGISG